MRVCVSVCESVCVRVGVRVCFMIHVMCIEFLNCDVIILSIQ